MDMFSRKIVGWSVGPAIHRELVLDAVLMAIRRRRPRGTLIHSDQGTQYGSDAWRRFCRFNQLQPSMSRKGNCWDNAVAESSFGSLKKERIKKQIYKPRALAQTDVDAYINTFDNRTRRHSYLGGLSPEQFEAAHEPRRQSLRWILGTPHHRSALPHDVPATQELSDLVQAQPRVSSDRLGPWSVRAGPLRQSPCAARR
jgi:putative transposase